MERVGEAGKAAGDLMVAPLGLDLGLAGGGTEAVVERTKPKPGSFLEQDIHNCSKLVQVTNLCAIIEKPGVQRKVRHPFIDQVN